MSVDLEERIRTVFEEHLKENVSVQEENVCSGVTRLLEKRRHMKHVDGVLRTQRQEFEVKRQSVRQRQDELKKKEDNLKDSLLKFDKFLKENDAKRARGVKKAESERAVLRERERELERLNTDSAALLVNKEKLEERVERFRVYSEFLHTVLKTGTKESSWTQTQAAAVTDTHQLSQIKVATLNLYHMTGGITGGDEGVDVDDTEEQLDRIRVFLADRAELVSHLRSDRSSRSSRLSDGV